MLTPRRMLSVLALFALLSGCGDEEGAKPKQNVSNSDVATKTVMQEQALSVLDISERELGALNSIAVMFNAPVNADQRFSKFISVQPELADPVLSEDGRTLHFTGLKPETKYEITVTSGLKGISGQSLKQSTNKVLTTRALPASIAFEVDGAVMIPGSVTKLPILAVNIPQAQVDLYEVKEGQTASFFDEYAALKSGDRWYFNEQRFSNALTHIHSSHITVGEEKNRRNRVGFSVSKVPTLTDGGLYLATVRAAGGFDYASTWFSISSIGIQARDYGNKTRYTLQNASSGDLLKDVKLTILDHNNQVIASGKSNGEGAWELDNNIRRKNPVLVVAEKDGQVTVIKYHAPEFDLSEFNVFGRPYRELELLTYAPRDIYRPGEEVIISTLLRDGDGQLLSGSINLEMRKPDGEKAGVWRLAPDQSGYYEFRYDLASNVPLGQWTAKVYSPGRKQQASYFRFQVEEFLPERLRLVFDEPKNDLPLSFQKGDSIRVPVTGEYLYGAPAAGNRLDTQVRVTPWYQPFPNLQGYRFGDVYHSSLDQITIDSMKLDDDGKTATVVANTQITWDKLKTPLRMNFAYSLFESGGRAINRNRSVLLWPKESFIGVKPLFEDDRADKESEALFDLVRANHRGELQASGQAKATLYRLEEKYFWSYTAERGWHYQTEKNEYPVANQAVVFSDGGKASLALNVEWGKYRLEVDDFTAQSKTIYHFNAGEDWYFNWNNVSDQITIALDKGNYKAGDKAGVKLSAPTNGKALVLLEAGGVLSSSVVELKDGQAELDILIPDDLARHDAYITAFVIAPTDDREKVSKRSFGAVHLPLNRDGRVLNVEIISGDTLSPEAQSEITINVTDAQGKPKSGNVFLTLSAVDSGVLSITGYEQPDPFKFFYERRAYNTRLMDMYDHLAEPTLASEASVRWGGDAELERGGEAPPADVKIISLFSSVVPVEEGVAKVNLDLPAFDGELTLTAVAMAAEQFGYQKETVKVVSPLVAQLSAPRFMAHGDRTRIALDLVNMTEAKQQISLALGVEGALKMPEQAMSLELEPSNKKVLHFNIDAQKLGEGAITALINITKAGGETLQIQRDWKLNVRPAYPAVYGSKHALLQKGEQLALPGKKFEQFEPTSRSAQLSLSDGPDFNAQQHAEALLRYPYACLEQTTSKVQPLTYLATDQAFLLQGVKLSAGEKYKQVNMAVNRYAELQRANGSFGLWDKHSPEEHWLTVYATDLLLRLQKQGYEIPQAMLEQATHRLQEYVMQRRAIPVRTWSSIPSHYEVSYQAYAAYVLAMQGAITLGPLRDLAEDKLDQAHGALPGVHLGLALMMTGSAEEGAKIVTSALQLGRTEGYLGDYGSDIRDKALSVASILSSEGISAELRRSAFDLVPGLLASIQRKRWLSTQERAALLQLAMTMGRYDHAGQWLVKLAMADDHIEIQGEKLQRRNLNVQELQPTFVENLTEKPVFATFSWTGIPETSTEAVNEGISLHVEHFKVTNNAAVLLQKNQLLGIGDQVLTRVRVFSESHVPDALLVNLLPAGLELENQNLKHALKLESLSIEGETIQQGHLVYQEYRDDRYVAAFNLPEKQEKTFYFLTRAVTPGEYVVPPAQAESMYQPDTRGLSRSIGKIVIVE